MPTRDRATRVDAAMVTKLVFIVGLPLGDGKIDPITIYTRRRDTSLGNASLAGKWTANVCSPGSPGDEISILGEERIWSLDQYEAKVPQKRGHDDDF
jgi:hypothetical protein